MCIGNHDYGNYWDFNFSKVVLLTSSNRIWYSITRVR